MKSHRVPIALQQLVMRVLRNKIITANNKLNKKFKEPIINYRQKGSIAGSAYLQAWEIRINPILLIENGEIFINQVVPHELAHLLVYQYFGKTAPHGKEWKWMMETILEVPPQRTHQFALKSVRDQMFYYRCNCESPHQLTARRHNKILNEKIKYMCKTCGQYLAWQE